MNISFRIYQELLEIHNKATPDEWTINTMRRMLAKGLAVFYETPEGKAIDQSVKTALRRWKIKQITGKDNDLITNEELAIAFVRENPANLWESEFAKGTAQAGGKAFLERLESLIFEIVGC